MQISKIDFKDQDYPEQLRHISSPPKQLFLLGSLPPLDMPLVAIVGTRKATDYGRQVTYRLAYDLAAAGVGVISGIAMGIDAVAHRAAVEAGGYTLAVQGRGLDGIQPYSNRGLAKQILAGGGAIVSEYEVGTPGLPHHFPARNRIIAGLSLATIVTEADNESGSLITAGFARDNNRHLMAVPGNITSTRAAGPNNLLRSGAAAVTSAVDVMDFLELASPKLRRKPVKPASKQEALIFKLLEEGVSSSQELIKQSELSASEFAQVISLMEVTGKVKNLGAGTWIKA